jgi:PhnB protein
MSQVKAIPEGMHTVTPHIVCKGAAEAMAFYQKAFGAELGEKAMTPDGKRLLHGQIRIGDSHVMLADEFPEHGALSPASLGGTPVTIHLYVEDADAFVNRAAEAGAKVIQPVQDAFWGDRYGQVEDPYGHRWSVATHTRDVSPQEMAEAACKMFSA